MAMQVRLPGQTEWYHPDRDISYNFHLWLRSSLTNLPTGKVGGLSDGDSVRLTETAVKLARLVMATSRGEISAEGLRVALDGLDARAMCLIGNEFLKYTFELFRQHRLDVLPKEPIN